MERAETASDWSAIQYLKFEKERTRAVHDLVAQIPLTNPGCIVDLGCGPGNSTAVLATRFPGARLSGVDLSPDMLARARVTMPDVAFQQADVRTLVPEAADLLFSNAVFHWLRRPERIPTIVRLLETLPAGGVLAFQVPDNWHEPSHAAMRETAAAEGPWTVFFDRLAREHRPELEPIESPAEFYDALIPSCQSVQVWHTSYQHVVPGVADIVEWVKATGLQPFVNALTEGEVRQAYLRAYERRLELVYPKLADGSLMLTYPRLFVVATKK